MTTTLTDQFTDDRAPDPLALDLRELTTDRGPETRLWEQAIAQHEATPKPSIGRGIIARLHHPLPPVLMGAAAAIVLCAFLVGILMPALGKARSAARVGNAAKVPTEAATLDDAYNKFATRADLINMELLRVSPASDAAMDVALRKPVPANSSQPALSSNPVASLTPSRSVIRKATLELDTPDVRAAFAKAQMVIRPDLGEFIEGSSLNGESKHAIAQITFRFAVSRMDTALNELRPLGTVKSETASGDDVTEQVVDLDARLRNERRVEQEVLALLESRKDAPLKEILDLRDKLAELRQHIEQLQGRKDTLARQVSLATVLLIIRPIDAPPEEPKSQLTPIGAYFSQQFESAWRSGTQTLADALSWLIRTLIGGLPWWIALAVVALLIRRAIRQAAANSPQNTWARPPLATGSPASPA